MNRGKISFGKIGLSLGTAQPDETPPVPQPPSDIGPATMGFGSFGKTQEEKRKGK